MNQKNPQRVERLAKQVLGQIESVLTAGLPGRQAEWARTVYQQIVLPYYLRGAEDAVAEHEVRLVTFVSRELRSRLQGLSLSDRWTEILRTYYHCRLIPLSEDAFAYARAYYEKALPVKLLQRGAADTHQRLLALIGEIEQAAPDLVSKLQPVIGESLVDCNYVLREADAVSLRLNQFIRANTAAHGQKIGGA